MFAVPRTTQLLARWFVVALCWTLLGAASALAQGEAGQITGKVTDPGGALVPGATITAKSLDNGATRTSITSAEGFYTLASLQPGLYEVSTQASGFAALTRRVQVAVGSNTTLNLNLSVTPVTGQQDVTEATKGTEINTRDQQQSDLLTGRQILELPTVTRDPFDLVSLSGNLTPVNARNGVNNGGAGTTTSRGISYSINGQNPLGNNIQFDGGEAANSFQAAPGQQLPLEAVQDIQVITSNYLPVYGRAIGGIINVATRQGSNDFRGSLFEFHRNRRLSTNSFENNALGIPKGQLTGNQFGYAIGGRIIRDRLFFFQTTEANLIRSREDQLALVPSASLLAASSLATQNFFNAFPLGAGTTGGVRSFTVADVRALTGQALTGNAFGALPAATPAFNLVRFITGRDTGAGLPQDALLAYGRLDFTLSDKHQIYGRYAIEHRDLFEGSFGSSPFAGFDTGAGQRNHSAVVNWTWTRSPRWLSNTKLAYTRYNLIRQLGAASGAVPRLLLTSSPANLGGFNVALPGLAPTSNGLLFSGPENILQLSQDFSTSFRGHQIAFGGSYFHTQDNRQFGAFQNAAATLGANITQGLGNLVAGQLSTFQTAIKPQGALPGGTITLPVTAPSFSSSTRANDFALNFNDVWRAHPRLTFNIGLRYDYFGRVRPRGGRQLSGFTTGTTGNNFFEQIASGNLAFGGQNGGTSDDNATYEQEWGNIGPRLGFAYDVFGNGRVALRGGYGLTYQGPQNNPAVAAVLNPASTGIATFVANTAGTGTLPITTNNFGPLAGTAGTVALPLLTVSGFQNFELQTAHTHLWSLALEGEFLPNTVASVQYLGAAGRDLYGVANVNRLGSGQVFNFGATAAARLNPAFGSIFLLNNAGRSNYHALQAEATTSAFRRIGLQFSARYRYAHALDNQSLLFNGGLNGFGRGFLNPFDPGQDYGSSDFDIRHRFVGSFNWEVPLERLTGGYAKYALGGWQVTGIFQARTGVPFSLVNCAGALTADTPCPRLGVDTTINNDSNSGGLADASIANRFVYINPAGFNTGTVPTTVGNGFFGTFASNAIGRNFFRGPGFWNIDAGVHKRFALREDIGLQFRAEFYNIFNHANAFVSGNEIDVNATSFVPGFYSGRRQIQLALRLNF